MTTPEELAELQREAEREALNQLWENEKSSRQRVEEAAVRLLGNDMRPNLVQLQAWSKFIEWLDLYASSIARRQDGSHRLPWTSINKDDE